MGKHKPRKLREFTVEFKEAAARRLLAGESSTALSRELDVKRSVLYRWGDTYRAEGVGGLSRPRGRPAAGDRPPPKVPRDPRDERIGELERLLGKQAAELDFSNKPFAPCTSRPRGPTQPARADLRRHRAGPRRRLAQRRTALRTRTRKSRRVLSPFRPPGRGRVHRRVA